MTTTSNFFDLLQNFEEENETTMTKNNEDKSSSTTSKQDDLAAQMKHSNELLTKMLQAMQAGHTEQRVIARENRERADETAREAREASAEIIRIVQVSTKDHHYDMDENRVENRVENRDEDRAEYQVESRSMQNNLRPLDSDTDFNKDTTDDEDDADDEFGEWPAEENDDEEEADDDFHDLNKCKKKRNIMRRTIKKLNKKVNDVTKEMENIKKAVNILSMRNIQKATEVNVQKAQNQSYSNVTSVNTGTNHTFPTLGAPKNIHNIYKTPAVLPIQRRQRPAEQTSQERLEEEFYNAASQIGFKPITFDHINKELTKLDAEEKLLDEKDQKDIAAKRIVQDFMIRELGIPSMTAVNMISQIETIHPPVTTEPNTWDILYVKFSSINIVNKVWSYSPNLPQNTPEDQIKTELRKYIPATLYDNFKAIEAIAYEQRKSNRMQTRVTIAKDRFILKCRSKDGQRKPWNTVPDFPTENLPMIEMSPRPRLQTQPERRTPTYVKTISKNTAQAPPTKPAPDVENLSKDSTQSATTITTNTPNEDTTDDMDTTENNGKRLLSPEEDTSNKAPKIRSAPPNDIGEKTKSKMTPFAVPISNSKRVSINLNKKTTPKKTVNTSQIPQTPKKKGAMSLEESTRRRSTLTQRSPQKTTNKQ